MFCLFILALLLSRTFRRLCFFGLVFLGLRSWWYGRPMTGRYCRHCRGMGGRHDMGGPFGRW